VVQAAYAAGDGRRNRQRSTLYFGRQRIQGRFLDHDLGFLDAAYPGRLHDNGKEVARYLAIKKFPGIVVIHSLNEVGAQAMKRYLPQAHIAPYGSFDIVDVRSCAMGDV
jgi:hypothetical protein